MLASLRALPHRLVVRLQRGVPRSVDIAVSTVVSAALIWLFAATMLFYYPQVQTPAKADAIVVLAGAASERLPVGRDLSYQGYADDLVLSTTDTPGNRITDMYCDYISSPAVTCFFPEPLTTRGEARAVARLAADNGWDNLIVVTSSYHLLRAETNISQCTTAALTMVPSDPDLSPKQWLGRFVEETGGLAAAVLRPACANRI
ncbi:YdcF family protein [Arthrobacter citreus]|uniref:YdcF family protein n=1 Tax=Arthrobacter TaxID=1663 RepID=UPI0012653B1D|nr:YdcF family protein [Arthrobacter gandavensis]